MDVFVVSPFFPPPPPLPPGPAFDIDSFFVVIYLTSLRDSSPGIYVICSLHTTNIHLPGKERTLLSGNWINLVPLLRRPSFVAGGLEKGWLGGGGFAGGGGFGR